MSGDLRDRVADVMEEAGYAARLNWSLVEAVCAVFAERERELRARIEALPVYTTRCRSRGTQIWVPLAALLALFDEAVSDGESCPVCGGVTAHVLGCSRMDVAR